MVQLPVHVVNSTFTHDEYLTLLQDCADQNLSGGIVYVALIFKAALFAKVEHLLTLNYKDFSRLSLDSDFVITPH